MNAVTHTPRWIKSATALGLMAAALWTGRAAYAASQITLTGSVAQNCTISVTADPNAASLNLTGGAQHVTVGTVLQNCNKKAGYTIVVSSANCAAGAQGAKVTGSVSGDSLPYTVEQVNPNTGGSGTDVTNLLATACTAQNARAVTGAKVSSETSTVFVNYTGNAGLGADTYQDTLTFTMNVN